MKRKSMTKRIHAACDYVELIPPKSLRVYQHVNWWKREGFYKAIRNWLRRDKRRYVHINRAMITFQYNAASGGVITESRIMEHALAVLELLEHHQRYQLSDYFDQRKEDKANAARTVA